MLHIAGSVAADMPAGVMRAMFAARKKVFVDLLKWDVPVLAAEFEVDQFDGQHAHYLVLANEDGAHLGSARLLPTLRPHILDSLYPDLCERPVPRDANIFEITRFCLDRSLSARDRRVVRDTLVVALAEHALANGITAYTAIAEIRWFQQILSFGWHCQPLGLPGPHGGKLLAALRIEIGADTPALLAQAGIAALPTLIGADRAAA